MAATLPATIPGCVRRRGPRGQRAEPSAERRSRARHRRRTSWPRACTNGGSASAWTSRRWAATAGAKGFDSGAGDGGDGFGLRSSQQREQCQRRPAGRPTSGPRRPADTQQQCQQALLAGAGHGQPSGRPGQPAWVASFSSRAAASATTAPTLGAPPSLVAALWRWTDEGVTPELVLIVLDQALKDWSEPAPYCGGSGPAWESPHPRCPRRRNPARADRPGRGAWLSLSERGSRRNANAKARWGRPSGAFAWRPAGVAAGAKNPGRGPRGSF